jgi:transcriptional regulator with XRE-family HTH domain
MPTASRDLGPLLKAWRGRLSPDVIGLPAHGARRAPGLRREEVANVAGLSVDYVIRLEQGRSLRPSAEVVSALGRALQLSEDEYAALHQAAGLPIPSRGKISAHVPSGVQRMVHRMDDLPVAVFTADWTLVQWNRLWSALIGDPVRQPPSQRNVAKATFIDPGPWNPASHAADAGHKEFERALAADLRRASTLYPEDPDLRTLVDELLDASPRFRELWTAGVVGKHESTQKNVDHPLVGALELDCDVFEAVGADLKIVVYSVAADTVSAQRLDILRSDAAV